MNILSENTVIKIKGTAVVGTEMYNTAKQIIVPDGITEIGAAAFYNCTYHLEEVVLPDSVTAIGKNAFLYCRELKKLNIPAAVRTIGEMCFADTAISEMVIPHGVTRIEPHTFSNSSLKSVTLPDTIEFIGKKAFNGTMLQTVFIPKSITTVQRDAFKNCPNLTIYCEGEPTDGWENGTEIEIEKEYITTAEDDAFNFHRSGGGFTSHAVETKKQISVNWNPDDRPVHTGVSREQYVKIISES